MKSMRCQNYLKMLLLFVFACLAVSMTSIVAFADEADSNVDAVAAQGEAVSDDEDAVQVVPEESDAGEDALPIDEGSGVSEDEPAESDDAAVLDDDSEGEEGVLTAQADGTITIGDESATSFSLNKGGSKTYSFSISKATVVDVIMVLENIDTSTEDIVNMTLVGHDVGSAGTTQTFYNTAAHIAHDPSDGSTHHEATHRWILSAGTYDLKIARAGSGSAAAMDIQMKTKKKDLQESFAEMGTETLAAGSKLRKSTTNYLDAAHSISLGTTYYGTETEYVPNDCYKIGVGTQGQYKLKFAATNSNNIEKDQAWTTLRIGKRSGDSVHTMAAIDLFTYAYEKSVDDEMPIVLGEGTYYITIDCSHDDASWMEGFFGQYSLSLSQDIPTKANPIKLSVAKNNVSVSEFDLANGAVTLTGMLKVSGQKGAVSYYKKASGDATLSVNDKGNIIVRKGTKVGTYTIQVYAKAAGGAFSDAFYKAGTTATVTLTVKVTRPKPTWSGATRMPVKSTADYKVTNGGWVRVKVNGKWATSDSIVSLSAPSSAVKRVTAKKTGTTTLYLLDADGKQVATKQVTVYAIHGKTYEFESSVDKNYVLDIQGGSTKDGAQMIVYKRNNGANQKYQTYLQSDGTYCIRSLKSKKWLTVESKTNKYVQQWAWKGTKAQRWRLTVDASNRVTFVNVKTNKCFDVQHGKTKNGAKMIVYKSNNGLNQKWKLNQK